MTSEEKERAQLQQRKRAEHKACKLQIQNNVDVRCCHEHEVARRRGQGILVRTSDSQRVKTEIESLSLILVILVD